MNNQSNDSSQLESSEQKEEDAIRALLSAKGKRMADSVAEYCFLRYFFGPVVVKDRRKCAQYKQAFLNDMQFNLGRGSVAKATNVLKSRVARVSSALVVTLLCRKR